MFFFSLTKISICYLFSVPQGNVESFNRIPMKKLQDSAVEGKEVGTIVHLVFDWLWNDAFIQKPNIDFDGTPFNPQYLTAKSTIL